MKNNLKASKNKTTQTFPHQDEPTARLVDHLQDRDQILFAASAEQKRRARKVG